MTNDLIYMMAKLGIAPMQYIGFASIRVNYRWEFKDYVKNYEERYEQV